MEFLMGIFLGMIMGVLFSREIVEWITGEKIEDIYKDSTEKENEGL